MHQMAGYGGPPERRRMEPQKHLGLGSPKTSYEELTTAKIMKSAGQVDPVVTGCGEVPEFRPNVKGTGIIFTTYFGNK